MEEVGGYSRLLVSPCSRAGKTLFSRLKDDPGSRRLPIVETAHRVYSLLQVVMPNRS